MRKSTMMVTAILALLCLAAQHAHAISLKKAMDLNLVEATITSNGGYYTKGLHMELTNKTKNYIEINIDPALVFQAGDASYQDLVILGDETISVDGNSTQSIDLQTFCARSSASVPVKGIGYTLSYQGDSAMIEALSYIKQNNLINDLGQSAVWALTNDLPLAAVFDGAQTEFSRLFIRYLASLTKQAMPEYYVQYKLRHDAQNRAVFDFRNAKIFVDMEWNVKKLNRNVDLEILKEDGSVYKDASGSEFVGADGTHIMTIMFDATKEIPGTYYVRIRDHDNQVLQLKKVKVGII